MDNIKWFAKCTDGVYAVVDDFIARLTFYIDILYRAVLQERLIGEYLDGIRAAPLGTFAIILLDYNMKFEPVRYRETFIEFLG